MRIYIKIILIMTIGLLAAIPALQAQFAGDPAGLHTFTNTQGASFNGTIVNVQDDNVSVKRADGQSFTVKISTFSAADQTYIRSWAENTVAATATGPIASTSTSPASDKGAQPPVGTASTGSDKLRQIIIPKIDIQTPTPLDSVVAALTNFSRHYDPDGKGLNFQVFAPPNGAPMPKITLVNLTNLSVDAILQIACKQAGYVYRLENSIVTLRAATNPANAPTSASRLPASTMAATPSSATAAMATRDFPLNTATYFRLVGYKAGDASPPPADIAASKLEDFFKRACGIDFPPGSKLVYNKESMSVTNAPNALDLIDNLLKKFNTP